MSKYTQLRKSSGKIPLFTSLRMVMFVDVHHADDPTVLCEAKRVARRAVIIKDHTLEGFLAGPILQFMDRMGNEKHGVPVPYNYWAQEQWLESFRSFGMSIGLWRTDLGLYPWPAKWIFERSLHFLAKLELGNWAGRVLAPRSCVERLAAYY